jgi:hypothetical protein
MLADNSEHRQGIALPTQIVEYAIDRATGTDVGVHTAVPGIGDHGDVGEMPHVYGDIIGTHHLAPGMKAAERSNFSAAMLFENGENGVSVFRDSQKPRLDVNVAAEVSKAY